MLPDIAPGSGFATPNPSRDRPQPPSKWWPLNERINLSSITHASNPETILQIQSLPVDTHDFILSCEPAKSPNAYNASWSVHYAGPTYNNISLGARLCVTLATEVAARIGNAKLSSFFCDVALECSKYKECYSGHVECAPLFEILAGNYYDLIYGFHTTTFDREVNHYAFWDESLDRTRFARDIYMGNYFGPVLNKVIDPENEFSKEFEGYRVYPWPPTPPHEGKHSVKQFSGGGAYYSLTNEPLNMSKQFKEYEDEQAARLGVMLRKRLRERGALL